MRLDQTSMGMGFMRTRIFAMGIVFAATGMVPFATAHADEYRHDGGDAIECTSQNFAREVCTVPWHDARLEKQLSDTRCVRDQNWGIDRRGLWVDHGCSGRFVAAGDRGRFADHDGDRANHGGWHPEPSWDQRFSVTCESQDGRDHFCQVDLGGGGHASLARQLSDAACVEGQSWGSNRAGVWVNRGCRGEFLIDRRWQ
jgi:hypothetical protein